MNEPSLSPDDPRLTAFALGELEGVEQAAVAAAVERDPALQAAVAEIQALAGDLRAALKDEPVAAAAPPPPRTGARPARRVLNFPAYLIGGLAAACLAVMVVLREREGPTFGRVVQMEPVRATVDAGTFDEGAAVDPSAPLLEQARQAAENLEFAAAVAAEAPPSVAARAAFPLIQPSPQLPQAAIDLSLAQQSAAVRREVRQLSQEAAAAASAARTAEKTLAAADAAEDARADVVGAGGWVAAAEHPAAVVPLDTSRGAYERAREALRAGRLPAPEAVREQEMVNAFAYDYAPPAQSGAAFAAHLEAATAPWDPGRRLVRVGLKAEEPAAAGIVARQARAQVAFNPARVASYRLVAPGTGVVPEGDAGVDFARGGMVTALYEIVPAAAAAEAAEGSRELLTLTVSYLPPAGGARRAQEFRLLDEGTGFAAASADFRLAAAAAGFGLILRGAGEGMALDDVARWVGPVPYFDTAGRTEFVAMVNRAQSLGARAAGPP